MERRRRGTPSFVSGSALGGPIRPSASLAGVRMEMSAALIKWPLWAVPMASAG